MTDTAASTGDPSPDAGRSDIAALARDMSVLRVGYLGPFGTFSEQALYTQDDLVQAQLTPLATIGEVLNATARGDIDVGFVPLENAIEGSVNVTLDMLAFDTELLIQREVVINIHMCLLAKPGTAIEDVTTVTSFPHATAQCRAFLDQVLPKAEIAATNSTADAARAIAEEPVSDGDADRPRHAAIAPARSAEVYGLEVLASGIEDHPENSTRFVVVARDGIPPATGHDKTSIAIYQRADVPGSLLSILQEFTARGINLSKVESRPTKRGLGDYCFLIDLEGHISDELVADALRDLKVKQADVKFMGSYPAAGEQGPAVRREADRAWVAADTWLSGLRGQLRS